MAVGLWAGLPALLTVLPTGKPAWRNDCKREDCEKVILDRAKLNGVVTCVAEETVLPWEGTLGAQGSLPTFHPGAEKKEGDFRFGLDQPLAPGKGLLLSFASEPSFPLLRLESGTCGIVCVDLAAMI